MLSPLTIQRQVLDSAHATHQYWLNRKNEFEHENFFSRVRWKQMGYIVPDTAFSLSLKLKTGNGTKSIEAYHASDVQVSRMRWKKLLRLTNRTSEKLEPTISHRQMLYQQLMDLRLDEYAEDLAYSLKPTSTLQSEVQQHQWLLSKLDAAHSAVVEAKSRYDELIEEITRQDYQPFATAERDAEEKYRRLLAQQHAEALDHLRQIGIDVTTIPTTISPTEIVALAFKGNLGHAPKRLDLGGIIDFLHKHDNQLALWAFDRYPQWVRVTYCKGRQLIKFQPPPLRWRCVQGGSDFPLAALGYQPIQTVTGSHGHRYYLFIADEQVQCTCPSASYRQGECKHVRTWKSKRSNRTDSISEIQATYQGTDPWAEFRAES